MDDFDLNDFSFDDLDGFEGDARNCFDSILKTDDNCLSMNEFSSRYFYKPDHSNSSSTNVLNEGENGQNRKRKVIDLELQQQLYKLPRPRAVKSDTRRAFPNIWANVFNSASYDYMMRHIEDFCDGNVSLLERDLRLIKPYGGRVSRGPGLGHGYLASFWFKCMNIAPDQVCTLKHTHLKTRSDGTSTIKCCFGLNGTKIIAPVSNLDKESIKQLENVRMAADSSNYTPSSENPPVTYKSELLSDNEANSIMSALTEFSSVEVCEDADSDDPTDDLRRFISSPSSSSSMSSQPKPQPRNPLQEVLNRYLKLTSANTSRRSRHPRPEVSPMVAEEWLAPPKDATFVKQEPACPTHNVQIKGNKVYVAESAGSSLRVENDRVNNVVYQYGVRQGDQGEVVLTVKMDTICSFEMEFNREGRITSMILNYIS